jgi:hypothetical protein
MWQGGGRSVGRHPCQESGCFADGGASAALANVEREACRRSNAVCVVPCSLHTRLVGSSNSGGFRSNATGTSPKGTTPAVAGTAD